MPEAAASSPVLTASSAPVNYFAGSGDLAFGGLSISGASTIDGADVTLGANPPYAALVFQSQLGITGSFAPSTGTLELSGTASVADYELALNSVAFEDYSAQPTQLAWPITVQVQSGGVSSNAVTRDIAITTLTSGNTLTINGGSVQDTIVVQFSDATDFAVTDDGATNQYSTSTVKHIAIDGGSGNETIIYSDPYNALTTTASLATAHGNSSNVYFDIYSATTLYVYSNAESNALLTPSGYGSFLVGVGSTTLNYSYVSDGVSKYTEVAGASDTVLRSVVPGGYAYVYSMPHATDLGDQTESWMDAGTQAIDVIMFSQLYIVGSPDGTDTIALDSDSGKFVATPDFSYVDITQSAQDSQDSGVTDTSSVLLGALYAKTVVGQAAGSADTAYFYSGSGDAFSSDSGSLSTLSGNSSNFTDFSVEAVGYQSVIAWSAGDRSDSATLSSTGGATFVGQSTYSSVQVASATVQVVGFAQVTADDGSGGNDSASLYDDTGANTLTASGNQAVLSNSSGTITVKNYATVTAYQQNGDDDTKHVGAIDYTLSTVGTWTSV